MARRTQIRQYVFTDGEHQEVDGKILPGGYLTRAKNVRLRKDGRFGVRADFDALGNDTANSADVVPYDLITYNDSLAAVVDGNGFSGDTAPWDLAQLVSTNPVDWRLTSQTGAFSRIGRMSSLREIPALPSGTISSQIASTNRIDCAATGGFVCAAMQTSSTFVIFHVIQASTGATVLAVGKSGIRPRVVVVGAVFFLLYMNNAGTTLNLEKFDTASDTTSSALTAVTTGTAINCYDAATNRAGTGFWVAYNLSTPTTSIVPFNSSGTAGAATTGPAVTYQHLAVRETANRVHLVSVIAGGATQLRSYTLAGALSSGPTTVTATTNDRQPGITDATFNGTEGVEIAVEATDATTGSVGRIQWFKINATTHVTIASNTTIVRNGYLGAKPAVGGSVNYHHMIAFVRPDGSFLSHAMACGDSDALQLVYCYKDRFAAVASNADTTPQIAKDSSTGKFYWPNLYLGADGNAIPRVTEFAFASNARRQTALLGGMLYLGGGLMQIFDGKTLVEAGFFDKPTIFSATPSNGAGALPSNTSLLVAATYEWLDRNGNLRQGDISNVSTVAMGAADDTITLSITGPLGNKGNEGPVTVAAYRSIDGVSQLRRAENQQQYTTAGTATITLLANDATTRAQGIIYTQDGRAALGAILPHEAPPPADFVWKFGARLLYANADQAYVSKELFPGEPVNFSGATGFTIPKISERITGVAALDQRGFLFTAERIYQFSGDGPNDAGEGRYSEPVAIPGSTGLMTWQSLVETPIGLFFQGSNGQLWVLPRDGSPPVWIGQPVRDTLVDYPTVTSATLVTKEQLVSFTCNNSGGTDSRIVSYDLRAKTWIVDEFATPTPITAACSYQGRLAILSGGVVYTERTSLTPNIFIEHALTTGTINEFGSSWGKYCTVGIVGEYRGDCDLRLRISYDDGKTYTNAATFQLRSANGLSVGDTVEREWVPARRKAQSIRLDFQARTAGSATEGFVFNDYWLELLPSSGGPRKASSERG